MKPKDLRAQLYTLKTTINHMEIEAQARDALLNEAKTALRVARLDGRERVASKIHAMLEIA